MSNSSAPPSPSSTTSPLIRERERERGDSIVELYSTTSNSSSDEDALLQEFKFKLKDLPKKIQKDNNMLHRYLAANANDVLDAEKSLRDNLKWREEYKPDKIKKADIPNALKKPIMFLHGRDKTGRPCLVIYPYKHDPKHRDLEESFRTVIYWIEKALKKLKPGVEQFVVIYDARLSSHYNQTDWALLKELLRLKDYYPERLGAVYVIKPNWIFHVLFSIISSILDKTVVAKIVLLDDNFKETLRKQFNESELLHGHGGPANRSEMKISLNSLKDTGVGFDSKLDVNSIPDVERYKLTLDAETDVEKQKKIVVEILSNLESNLVISDVHKDLLKNSLNHILVNLKSKNFLHSFNGEKVDTTRVKLSVKSVSVLRDKCDKIQLDIANLAIKKQRLEAVIREAEMAKNEIPQIELQLEEKRKDLVDAMKFVKSTEEVENKLSIVPQVARRQQLIDKIPKIAIKVATGHENACVIGPEKDGHSQSYLDIICGKSVSLYPLRKESGREGDPIADRFSICHYSNSTIFAIADGCGWGTPAKDAAIVACNVFVEYMKNFKSEITTTTHAVRMMLRAFSAAHYGIIESANRENEDRGAGTTTILGGMTFELLESSSSSSDNSKTNNNNSKLGIIIVCLGDCHSYLYSIKQHKIVELHSQDFKLETNDVKDPGGRIGPYLEGGEPDLRNLDVFYATVEAGDIVVLLSDGVHDNLDPLWCGKTPKDANIIVDDNNWNNVKHDPFSSKSKADWTRHFVTSLINEKKSLSSSNLNNNNNNNNNSSNGSSNVDFVTPSHITERLIMHATSITKNSRNFMESFPNKKLPDNKPSYPGKMDHATCACFRI